MLQFNLLPDVKKEYIKAKRQKQLILSVSILAAGAALLVVILLFSFVQLGQKKHIKDLSEDINTEINAIRSIEDLDKILTIQGQLVSLPSLHQQKPETSRLFSYLTQLTPANVKIRQASVNFIDSVIVLEGVSPDLASINRFSDTLKFSKFKAVPKVDSTDPDAEQANVDEAEELVPFTNIATELSRSDTRSEGERSTYQITLNFDKALFDNMQIVKLIVPNIVTTRSTQGKPNISDQTDNPLFENNSTDSDGGGE